MKFRFSRRKALRIVSGINILLWVAALWVFIHHWQIPGWMPGWWYAAVIVAVCAWGGLFLGDSV